MSFKSEKKGLATCRTLASMAKMKIGMQSQSPDYQSTDCRLPTGDRRLPADHRRMAKGLILLLTLCGAMGLSGCLSEISFSVPQYDHSQTVSIRGSLVAADTPYIRVQITSITNFSAKDIPVAVSGAGVLLSDEANHLLSVPMTEPGIYELTIPENTYELEVKPGKSYQLSVTTPGGKTYTSAVELLLPVPAPIAIDTLTLTREILNEYGNLEDREFIRFLIQTPLAPENGGARSYLKWNFLGTYKFQETALSGPFPPNVNICYFHDKLKLDKVVVFNGAAAGQDLLQDFLLLEEPLDYRFYEGFYLTVTQQSLSEGAFHYWDHIGRVTDLNGSFFETQPGKVRGNFHNTADAEEEVFGYFYATQEAIFRLFIRPLPERVVARCPPSTDNANNVDYVCINCLSHPGSTTVKPDFWEQ